MKPIAPVLAALLLAACGSTPPVAPATDDVPAPVAAPSASPASLAFERKQRERAQAQMRQGALGEAALSWEILHLLRPDAIEYTNRLAETRLQIDMAVAERMPRAAQAYQRGELDAATQQYLAILALQPEQAQAAEALRAIERDRVKRNNLGKLSRITLTRRAVSDALVDAPLPAPAPGTGNGVRDRNDLEHATMLADQGEFDEAIRLLERRLSAERRDLRSRDLLAEVYCRKGDTVLSRDKDAAIAAYERCLRWRPGHPVATARLRELKPSPAGPAASAPRKANSAGG